MNINIYYEREKNSNPYYLSQKGLSNLSELLEILVGDEFNATILRWQGGARSGLSSLCTALVALDFSKEEIAKTIEPLCQKYGCKIEY